MNKNTKLVAFDMDGTLIETKSSWGSLNKEFGIDSSDMLKRYMNGEITDQEFVDYDIRNWNEKVENLNIEKINTVLDKVKIRNGAKELISEIKKMGIEPIIISGGITHLANRISKELGIDKYYANDILEDENGNIYGKINLDSRDKGAVLRKILDENNIKESEVVAVGDEEVDIGMFEIAEISIVVNTENSKVIEKATHHVKEENLLEILEYIGDRDE